MKVLVTGGAGFIGSQVVRTLLNNGHFVRILDSFTYAGNRANVEDIKADEKFLGIIEGNICNEDVVINALSDCDAVVHLAAESHVNRSIDGPRAPQETNYLGTFTLLEAARQLGTIERFINISTDEVYGTAEEGKSFVETDPLNPRNPYSASKAAADILGRSYYTNFGVPVITHRAANNYGPRQFPEKLIPLFCYKALHDQPLPIYGNGRQVRDWLHVEDNARAILLLLEKGKPGEVYNVPGGNEHINLEVIYLILKVLDKPSSLKSFVEDRMGHDVRYSIDGSKIKDLGWKSEVDWEIGMPATILWFETNKDWLEESFNRGREFHERYYRNRGEDK